MDKDPKTENPVTEENSQAEDNTLYSDEVLFQHAEDILDSIPLSEDDETGMFLDDEDENWDFDE